MPLTIRLICDLDDPAETVAIDDNVIGVNCFPLALMEGKDLQAKAASIRDRMPMVVGHAGQIQLDKSTFWIARYIGENISRPEISQTFLTNLRLAIARVTSAFHANLTISYPDSWPRADLNATGLVRYGNVELRVLENYITSREMLRDALVEICSGTLDEEFMYRQGARASYLSADNEDQNLRALMTNAGMYLPADPDLAWDCLSTWCETYLAAIKNCPLASFTPAYPFFFNVQRALWDDHGVRKTYMDHPSIFDFHNFAKDKKLLVVSPLADCIRAQIDSGNIRNLFTNRELPALDVSTIKAPISTFPNRPHEHWLASFRLMQQQIDEQFSRRPCDAFAASCGCYGLSLCDYVSRKYGVPVLYLGNIMHAFFGIIQNATAEFMIAERNESAWIRGNLGAFKNVALIDGGRYV